LKRATVLIKQTTKRKGLRIFQSEGCMQNFSSDATKGVGKEGEKNNKI
jgi:hypothetical protein